MATSALLSPSLSSKSGDPDAEPPNPSRIHFNQTYFEVKYLGSGENGDTFAAILKMDAKAILVRHLAKEKSAACFDQLRSKVVAIKVPKEWAAEGDLKNEIRYLTKMIRREHPCYTQCIDSFIKNDVQWLALPFITGGDLEHFAYNFPHAMSVSFRFHVAHQLARAMLFLTSGSTDEKRLRPVIGWPRNTHGDIFVGNVLLRPPHTGGFADFPDIVIADFGRASTYPNNTFNNEQLDDDFRHDLRADMTMIVDTLKDLRKFYIGSDQRCLCPSCCEGERCLSSFLGGLSLHESRKTIWGCLQTLQNLASFAHKHRVGCYHRMPSDALVALKAPKVSDADLESAIDRVVGPSLSL